MALIDLYQLALLHKLARDNAGVLSNRSSPPLMPVTTRSQAVQSAQVSSNYLSITRGITPNPYGSTVMQKLEPDAERPRKPSISKYEQYIAQDFERHRVFVDMEVFMRHVLHVPENWRKIWGKTIQDIKHSDAFWAALCDYNSKCEIEDTPESSFYEPLVDMVNAVFDFADGQPLPKALRPKTRLHCLRNDPKKILNGILSPLIPDIVTVHEKLFEGLLPEERQQRRLQETNLTWAHPLQMLEVKPGGRLLVDGSWMPRLKVNGRDPQECHAKPDKEEEDTPAADNQTDERHTSAPNLPIPCKRPATQSVEPNRKSQKVHLQSTPGGGAGGPGGGGDAVGDPTKETKDQKEAYLQVGRYLLEQFSVPAFRSHATIGLVDRDRIQFYHANHSVILVSSAISFSTRNTASEIEKLIAAVIAFSRLSLRDSGILHDLRNGGLFMDNEKLPTSTITRKMSDMQDGNQLVLGKGKKQLRLTLGKLISHEPSLAGRGTAVLRATSSGGDSNLVVKISWPGSGRVPEDQFLTRAIEMAKSSEGHKWALNHLPRVVHAQSIDFDSDSTHGKVASLFEKAEFVNGGYEYERRTLRIIVQERLYPLKTLTDVREIAQVLLDVACIHRWLYEVAGILHRDLSPNNVMYRKTEDGKVYGVLTDFDLSSWTVHLAQDYTKTSQQRTGTPPYMAYGLLKGTDASHLYRHDVESILYIILILATRYEIRAPKEGKKGKMQVRQEPQTLPYSMWFNQPSYKALASFKRDFLSDALEELDLSPGFEDFRDWLTALHHSFRRGILAKGFFEINVGLGNEQSGGEGILQFDNATLGGHVCYSSLINPARNLKGKLEGLTVRYESEPPSSNVPSPGTTKPGI